MKKYKYVILTSVFVLGLALVGFGVISLIQQPEDIRTELDRIHAKYKTLEPSTQISVEVPDNLIAPSEKLDPQLKAQYLEIAALYEMQAVTLKAQRISLNSREDYHHMAELYYMEQDCLSKAAHYRSLAGN